MLTEASNSSLEHAERLLRQGGTANSWRVVLPLSNVHAALLNAVSVLHRNGIRRHVSPFKLFAGLLSKFQEIGPEPYGVCKISLHPKLSHIRPHRG